jgi:DNA replication protein DnaC
MFDEQGVLKRRHHESFGDEKLTTALLDRIGHHAHIITTKGASYRTQRRAKKSSVESLKGNTT